MSKAGDFLRKIKLGKIVKGLVREGLQTLPVIGTVITNLKTDTPENPKGKLNAIKMCVEDLKKFLKI